MSYNIITTPSAEHQFRGLPKRVQINIRGAIYSLAEEPLPEGCRKLKAHIKLWSIKVGNYWVIYTIWSKELIVLVVKIGDCREVYQKLDRIKL